MQEDFIKPQLTTDQSPQQVLSDNYFFQEWPICGGWGYSPDDACVIELDDESEGVHLEYEFLKHRTYEELIDSQPEGEKYEEVEIRPSMQRLVEIDGKPYDHLIATVSCLREQDWEALFLAKIRLGVFNDDPAGQEAYQKLYEEKLITFETEGWFDISHFFGHWTEDSEL